MGALTYDWFDKSQAVIIAEATRVGAIIGTRTRSQFWKPLDVCPCQIEEVVPGMMIRCIDGQGNLGEVFVEDPLIEREAGANTLFCLIHQGVSLKHLHRVLLSENNLKSYFGSAMENIKGDRPYRWSFDGERHLVIDVSNYLAEEILALKVLARHPKWEGKIIING